MPGAGSQSEKGTVPVSPDFPVDPMVYFAFRSKSWYARNPQPQKNQRGSLSSEPGCTLRRARCLHPGGLLKPSAPRMVTGFSIVLGSEEDGPPIHAGTECHHEHKVSGTDSAFACGLIP